MGMQQLAAGTALLQALLVAGAALPAGVGVQQMAAGAAALLQAQQPAAPAAAPRAEPTPLPTVQVAPWWHASVPPPPTANPAWPPMASWRTFCSPMAPPMPPPMVPPMAPAAPMAPTAPLMPAPAP